MPTVLWVLGRAVAQYAALELLWQADARRRVQRAVGSVALLLGAAVTILLALVLFIASFFFQLAEFAALVQPAIITASLAVLFGLLLLVWSWQLWRRAWRRY